MSHQTGSNGRLAKKKGLFFALWKNDITDVSLFASYCYFIQEARHGFRKKEINCLAQQTICSRTLNEQMLMRKYLCVYWRRYQSSSLGVCCSNEIPFVASSLSAKKKEMNTEQCRQQSSLAVEHRLKHLENCYAPHLLEVDYIKDLLFFFQQCTFSSPWEHFLWILSSLLPFTRNLPSTRLLFSRTRRRQRKNFITKVLIGKLWFTIFPGQLLKGFQRKEENKYRMC